jgi:hypothetical protein
MSNTYFRFRPSWLLGTLLALTATFAAPSVASAQQNDRLIDELLNSLRDI